MTARQSVHSQACSLAGTVFLHRFFSVLGTAGKKAAATAEQRTDRVSVKAQERQQQVFHWLIVEVSLLCSTNPGFLSPWLAGQWVVVWPPGEARNHSNEAEYAASGTALWPGAGPGCGQLSDAENAWRPPVQGALQAPHQLHAGGNVAGNAGFSAPS